MQTLNFLRNPFAMFHSAAFLFVALACCMPSPATAQVSNRNSNSPPMFIAEALSKDAVFWTWRNNPNVQQCGYCHYPSGNDFAQRKSELSRLDELKLWLENDKHAIARQRIEPIAESEQAAWLTRFRTQVATESDQRVTVPDFWVGRSNDLSAKICQQLGKNVSTEPGHGTDDKWFRESCLTCHGGYEIPAATAAKDQDPRSTGNATEFDAQGVNRHPGISCNYCHQESNGNSQWIDLHSGLTSVDKWRALSPSQKSEVGMRDLTPAHQQAQLCLDCHVGNIKKGMFVTHAMYAAGHPPLPAVELRTLVEEMPRHWKSPSELAKDGLTRPEAAKAYFKVNYGLDADPRGLQSAPWDAYTIAVGALAAQQHSIDLLVQAGSTDHWGDYALYDCSACHHELHPGSQRQTLRAPGAPGRPRLTEWPHPGALAAAAALGDEGFNAAWVKLQAAVKQRPFGDRQAVVQAGQELNQKIAQSLEQLTISRMPPQYGSRFLSAICETSSESLLDYQTARWVNWSARGLLQGLGPQDKRIPDVEKRIAMLGQAIGPDGRAQSTVTRTLPSTQKQVIYPDFVERELTLQKDYDANAFINQLREIRQSLR